MARHILLATAVALGIASAVAAQPLPPSEPPGPLTQPLATPDFVVAAGQSDQFEIEEGRLASMRSQLPRVRDAASMMIRAHRLSTHEMQAAARRAGLPSAPAPGLDVGQQQMFERLKATTGPAFDRLYVDQQVHAHQTTLAVITSYVRDGRPGPIRQAASQIRPVVVRHLAMFERLKASLS